MLRSSVCQADAALLQAAQHLLKVQAMPLGHAPELLLAQDKGIHRRDGPRGIARLLGVSGRGSAAAGVSGGRLSLWGSSRALRRLRRGGAGGCAGGSRAGLGGGPGRLGLGGGLELCQPLAQACIAAPAACVCSRGSGGTCTSGGGRLGLASSLQL